MRSAPVEVSIIVPCFNEAENVIELTERARAMFDARGIAGEVVFVDDASTDHTGALIDELAARHDFVRAVHHTTNKGMPGGWASGVAAASGRYVVIMDGDLQYLPEDVYRLYRQLLYTNADVAQGWRSHIGRPRDFRYTMSRVLHYILRALFGLRLHDIKSGFLICDREIFAHMLRRRFSYWYFQTFIVLSAHHKGYRIEEIESLFEERKLGESFIAPFPFRMIVKNLVDVAKGFVEFRLLPHRTDVLGDFLAQHPVAREPEPLSPTRRLSLRLFAALMPLHHWKRSASALRYYHELRRSQWLAPEPLRALQEARLRTLMRHAYRHVPHYRELLDRHGIEPDDIRSVDDLERLPLLTKDAVRRTLHFDLMSDSHDKRQMLPITTSGSTGEPLTLYVERTQLEMRWAADLRSREWTGYRFGDRVVRLWDMPLGSARLQKLRDWLDAQLSRRAAFVAVAAGREALEGAAALVRRRGRALVEGGAAALQTIAARMSSAARPASAPLAVISSGATLTPEARAAIEDGFQARVFDRYGSRELGTLAQECEVRGGYHVNAESYVVEIVRDGRAARPGEVGEVVVTDLSNLCVPLIRYATGDYAVATERQCPCGRGLPLIEAVRGRAAAVLVGDGGAVVPATFFSDVLSEYGHVIRRFQVVQSEPGAVQLRVIKGPRYSPAAVDRLIGILRQHLGPGFTVSIVPVEQIPAAEDGSHPPFVALPASGAV